MLQELNEIFQKNILLKNTFHEESYIIDIFLQEDQKEKTTS